MRTEQVGIDAVAVHVPRLFVDVQGEWAQVRAPELGEPSVEHLIGKVTRGVGVRYMALPDAHEDSATMAAMAAKKVIDAAGIDPRDIDYLAVGTETTVDQSKSIAAYVLGMLEMVYGTKLPYISTPQMQFACIGAAFALEAAVSRIRAKQNSKPYALVIATDISRYPLRSAGEYTQGAGAVALLIKQNPRLVVLEAQPMSVVTRDDRDFFRPNWSQTAVVDGKYSIRVYLDCIEAAWNKWIESHAATSSANRSRPDRALDYLLFHVPFPRMAEYAAARILGSCWLNDVEQRQQIAQELPLPATQVLEEAGTDRLAWERKFAQTGIFRQVFAQKVEPSLSFGAHVGNIYSGSLYAALANLLDHAATTGTDLTERRVGFFSYGSGASAAVWSGVIAPTYAEVPVNLQAELALEADGGRRVAVNMALYEALHDHREAEFDIEEAVQAKLREGAPLTAAETQHLAHVLNNRTFRLNQPGTSVIAPRNEFALVRLGTDTSAQRTDWGYRYYAWLPG